MIPSSAAVSGANGSRPICPASSPRGRLSHSRWSCFQRHRHLHPRARLPAHPVIQQRLLETPPVSQLERRNKRFGGVFIESIRTDPEVIGCLSNVHHFADLTALCSSLHPGCSGVECVRVRPRLPGSLLIPRFMHLRQQNHEICSNSSVIPSIVSESTQASANPLPQARCVSVGP